MSGHEREIMRAKNKRQQEEIAELRKDAQRYRFLRRQFDATKCSAANRVIADLQLLGTSIDCFDAIVDSSMEAAKVMSDSPFSDKWYIVDRQGWTYREGSRAGADQLASEWDRTLPGLAPHRVMQLADAAEVERLRAVRR